MAENETKPEKKLEEANFEVSSLSEVKDENGNGIFHMRTKTKIILFISILILLASGALIYLFLENYIQVEVWQVAIWGLCAVLSIYSVFSKSILTLLLNLILFAVVSFIPTWQSGYKTFQPIIEKFTSEESAPVEQPANTPQVEVQKEVPQVEHSQVKQPAEQTISEPEPKVEDKPVEQEPESKTTSAEENTPARTNSLKEDLPSI